MPGIPLVSRETMYGQSRSGDRSCRQDSRAHMSPEEEVAAEESLTLYCKPVELYNILLHRSVRNPLFLQRCLHYKLHARRHKRVRMSVSLSETLDDGLQVSSLFPIHIILARLLSDVPNLERTAVYRYTCVRTLTNLGIEEGGNMAQANFNLPEMNKLLREANPGSLFILFVSYAWPYASNGFDPSKEHPNNISFPWTVEKPCLWGKISMKSLFLSWEKFPNLNQGDTAEIMSTVDLRPSVLKCSFAGDVSCISFHIPENFSDMNILPQIRVTISAEERGAKEKSPYKPCTYNNILASTSHVVRLRTGNVIFNYKYYHNKLRRTEVTEDFSCPFCLVKCASFEGLKLHLPAFHDLFVFEFWVTEELQAVNVSVKTNLCRSEVYGNGIDPKELIFFFCYKPLKRRKLKGLSEAKHIQPFTLTSNIVAAASDLFDRADDAYSSRIERARSSSVNETQNDTDCIQSNVPGNSLAPPATLQFAKTRKLSERSDIRSRALLEKRQFFHSQKAQPMALEQILADHDSEDEVDDDVADLEDRRLLDDFLDVSKEEKQMMHLWNSFVRKQRVLADGHIPWACEAFSRLHGRNLVQAPALIWCWRLFMLKLWNQGLLDARSMNNCNLILDESHK